MHILFSLIAFATCIALCFLTAPILLMITKAVNKKINSHLAGIHGERVVAALLEDCKTKTDIILNDILLDIGGGRTTQIDHVLIKREGIFVIETKNYKGVITGSLSDKNWVQHLKQKYTFYNPLLQNDKHLKHLRRLLKCQSSNLYSIVVFTHKNSDISDVYAKYKVIKSNELKTTIADLSHQKINKYISPSKVYADMKPYILDNSLMNRRSHLKNVQKAKQY